MHLVSDMMLYIMTRPLNSVAVLASFPEHWFRSQSIPCFVIRCSGTSSRNLSQSELVPIHKSPPVSFNYCRTRFEQYLQLISETDWHIISLHSMALRRKPHGNESTSNRMYKNPDQIGKLRPEFFSIQQQRRISLMRDKLFSDLQSTLKRGRATMYVRARKRTHISLLTK